MKIIKFILTIVLILTLSLSLCAEQRAKAKVTMKELSDPESLSYVPYPYPKNRKEIIADIEYYVETFIDEGNTSYPTDQIFLELFKPNSQYKIGKIIKVQNRIAGISEDYTWLILVLDKKGHVTLRTAFRATGLFSASGSVIDENFKDLPPNHIQRLERLRRLITDTDVKNILAESLGRTIENNEIEKINRVAYASTKGMLLFPLWEVEMKDGTRYCYTQKHGKIYSMETVMSWKKKSNGLRSAPLEMLNHRNYLPDTINDQIIILKELPMK